MGVLDGVALLLVGVLDGVALLLWALVFLALLGVNWLELGGVWQV